MSTLEHRRSAGAEKATCCVLTISDTRTQADDASGKILIDRLEQDGHRLIAYAIVKDEPDQIEAQINAWLADEPDVILTTGGTGIARRDTTVEVVRRLLDKELEGFGELFRMLSWEEVGPAAMLSRAVAGLAGETLIFAMPGSKNAVRVAMEKLVAPELPHLIWERKR